MIKQAVFSGWWWKSGKILKGFIKFTCDAGEKPKKLWTKREKCDTLILYYFVRALCAERLNLNQEL